MSCQLTVAVFVFGDRDVEVMHQLQCRHGSINRRALMVGLVGRRVVWCPTECVVDESRRRRVIALSPNSLLSRRGASLDADVFSASAASSDVTRQ